MKSWQGFPLRFLLKRVRPIILALALLFLPWNAFADSDTDNGDTLLLLRLIDSIDLTKLSELKKVKLTAVVKMDAKGDIVISCLNYSMLLAHAPFSDRPGLQSFLQRTHLQLEPKRRGIMVKVAFLF